MLTVDSVVPQGVAAGLLEPGDVLVRVNGRIVTEFLSLEDACDAHVGGALRLELQRKGEPLHVEVGAGQGRQSFVCSRSLAYTSFYI